MNAHQLTALKVDEVSVVDKAANGKKFLILKTAGPDDPVEKCVAHEGGKWVVYSKDKTQKLGEYDTKKEAENRVGEVHAFESVGKSSWFGWLKEAIAKAAGNSGPTTEVEEMTAEEIKKAIAEGAAEALAPMDERIKKLEAGAATPAATPVTEGPVAKTEGDATLTPEQITKMVTDGVAEAMKPVTERIEKLEGVQGDRQSALDEKGAHKVEKSAGFWEGSGLLL